MFLWYKRFSYKLSCERKEGRISKSGLLEFTNSRVFSKLQRYLLMMKAAITKLALF
jgi:hypothetical protein